MIPKMTSLELPEFVTKFEIQKNNLGTFELIVKHPSGSCVRAIIDPSTEKMDLYKFLKATLLAGLALEGYSRQAGSELTFKIKIRQERKSNWFQRAGWAFG